MYVFVTNVPGVDFEILPPRYEFEHALEFLFDVGVFEYLPAVLGTPYNVIVADPGSMGLLIQTSVRHGKSPLVGNIDHGDFLMGYALKRPHRLKPVVLG